jgi:uncharacterized protein (DUF433 family)
VVDIINIDKDILGGKVVFNGTRVPVESLYDHLNEGVLLNDFLEDFPSVSKYQALALLN